ncbi:ABC transporter substrate-binding protein [Ramlibacter sp. AW1]|uniref:ABC transporter substrate-binding protein n=1 Tax=Ramlibacter aurantiacus TaxID=2801330 RepID=A0A937D5T8_9BURK|nr:ABC transporter substrate-binding protein [Ramlibacter aurantiacus]MBL0419091.1 ABC transporter substrate-binding protein [Ramlibacter aurantiacus]
MLVTAGASLPAFAQQKLGSVSISAVPSTSAVVLYVARDQGYFEREGLDVNIKEFTSGAEAERAMLAGAVDMAGGGVGTTMLMANQGIKAKNVVLFQKKPIFTLVASDRVNAKPGDLKALKGKTIGVSSPGSLTDLFLRIALRDAGLDPDRDVTIVATGGLNSHLPALQAGRVDAQMTWEPATVNITKKEKAATVFMDLRGDDVPPSLQNLLGSSLQATDKWLSDEKHLQQARAAARAVAKASRAINQNPDLMLPSLQRMFPTLSQDLLKEIARVEAPSFSPVITKEAIEHMNKIYRSAGLTKADVSYSDITDPRLATEWK